MDSQRRYSSNATARELLTALVDAVRLDTVVPQVIALVEEDPLASAGCFSGDLLRGLMEVPSGFWGRHPALYDRYREAVRAGASARRKLTPEARLEFWSAIEL